MASKKLEDLNPETLALAKAFLAECERIGLTVLIYCTLRSNGEQAALYAIGRTLPGRKVTNARPGESAHNPDESGKANAFDGCPIRHGKPVWESASKEDSELWRKYGQAAEAAGLVWSGRWTGKLKEMCHCQNPNWRKPE